MSASITLMTIGPSHYCEKARWALDYFGVDYTEEPHPPMVHWWWSLRSGAGRTVPILQTGDRVIGDSTDILHFLDTEHTGSRWLYPPDDGFREEVEQLADRFDTRLGPHTRRLVYFHLLPHKALALSAINPGVGGGQRFVFTTGYPIFRRLMFRGMNITPESADRSLEYIRQVFRAVDSRLSDGRDYLVGSSFTAADLTFAALAAPVLLPDEYGAPLPGISEIPQEVVELIEEFRGTAAGAHVLKMYREHR